MKIFILAEQIGNDWYGFAVAEDGTGLTGHISSSPKWLRIDMGIGSPNKHEVYAGHCPGGYTLVDLIEAKEEDLLVNTELQRALKINRGQVDA